MKRAELQSQGEYHWCGPGPDGSYIWLFRPRPIPRNLEVRLLAGELEATKAAYEKAHNWAMGGAGTTTEAEPFFDDGFAKSARATLEGCVQILEKTFEVSDCVGRGGFKAEAFGSEVVEIQRAVVRCWELTVDVGLRQCMNAIGLYKGGMLNRLHNAVHPSLISEMFSEIETFIQNDEYYDPIIRAILVNYQLIAVQPFLDGNSRTAAIVVERLLREWSVIDERVLPVRAGQFFLRGELTDALYNVTRYGAWIPYIALMLRSIRAASIFSLDRHLTVGAEADPKA